MIIFIFNSFFPDDSGFAKRCEMEINLLSKKHKMIVICRNKHQKNSSSYKSNVQIERYDARVAIVERPKFYIPGLYEIVRNIDLFFSLSITLNSVISQHKKKNIEGIKLYVVSSPLTVPLIAFVIGKIRRVSLEVLEFHDLEPELAKHMKMLSETSIIMKIEYFLEKWMCKVYKKIVVTSQGQAERIMKRTGKSKSDVFIIPNAFPIETNKVSQTDIRKKYNIGNNDFVISYSSTLHFDYTINGVKKLLKLINKVLTAIPSAKLMIIGGGDGLSQLQDLTHQLSLDRNVIFTGKIKDVADVLHSSNVLIIPWEKDEMTKTILPTKLFEYMQAKKPIIAPNFGEFKVTLEHRKDALLYSSFDNLLQQLLNLFNDEKLRSELSTNTYKKYTVEYSGNIQEKRFQEVFN